VNITFDSEPLGLPTVHGAEISGRAHELHARAGELFGLYGHAADAPRANESDIGYTRRILKSASRYSATWAGVDFDKLPTSALPVAVTQVIDGGVQTFRRTGAGTGQLREEVTHDHSGRKLIKFYGDPENCWAPFKDNVMRLVTGWNTSLGKGANAPGAVRPVGTLMSDGSVRQRV
jgi:hypothetical protein